MSEIVKTDIVEEDIGNPLVRDNEIDDSGYFKPNEEEILSFVQNLRYDIIKKKTDNGKDVPTDNRDIRVINELSSSLVEQITKIAELRQKEQETAVAGGYQAMIAQLLLEHHSGNLSSENINEELDRRLPNELDKKEIIEGELAVNSEPKDLDKIMSLIE